MRRWTPLLLVALSGCSLIPRTPRLALLPFAADTIRTQKLANGLAHHFIYSRAGPWAIHVLDADMDRCYSPIAVKGAAGGGAGGRQKTSALLATLTPAHRVLGGVNADFFALTGIQGVPAGLLVLHGRVVA